MGSVKPPATQPSTITNVSELATILKPRYPRQKLDTTGRKYAKGFRNTLLLTGPRPLQRRARRPT